MGEPAFDLFSYPQAAGHRGSDTSRAAAESIPAHIIRGKVLKVYELRGPCTADEVAEALHMSVLTVRPRVTELKAMGKLVDTRLRRPNKSGRKAAVLKAVVP